MNDELLRVLIDIEVISCLAIVSGLFIAASLEDIRAKRPIKKDLQSDKIGKQLSLQGVYKDYELAALGQIDSGVHLIISITFKPAYAFLRTYALLITIMMPVVLGYITYEAMRFHTGFLTAVAWISLCGFTLLAIIASRDLGLLAKLRLIILSPVVYWPFILLSVFWSLMIIKNFLKSAGVFFMEARVLP